MLAAHHTAIPSRDSCVGAANDHCIVLCSYDRKLYGTPAATEAPHPLGLALRQVGGDSRGDTGASAGEGAKGTGRPAELEANSSARKKSRKT